MTEQILFVFLLSLVISTVIQASPKENQTAPPSMEQIIKMEVIYTIPEMEAVESTRNIEYKVTEKESLKMDIYYPPNQARKDLPAVILVHGAPPFPIDLMPKDWGVFVSYGKLIAASGFAAVTFNHRTYGMPATWNQGAEDVKDLISYVREHAESLGIDPNKLGLWVFSAGGPYASLGFGSHVPYVHFVICYYAVLDLSSLPNFETLKSLSPRFNLSTTDRIPPLLIMRAGLDSPKMNHAVDAFLQEALSRNAPLFLANHPNGHHGFDVLDHNEQSREIIRQTLEFIRTRFGNSQKDAKDTKEHEVKE